MQTLSAGGTATDFAYDGLNMLAEYDGSGMLQRRYVFGPGTDEPILQYEGSSTTDRRWLYADERGSVMAIADASGNVIATNAYDEYGNPPLDGSGHNLNSGRFQYTGQAWLPELGLYYYKARLYSPTLGRFLQPDPIGYAGDGPNLYAYVLDDPVNFVDPLGMTSEDFTAADATLVNCADACYQDIIVTGTRDWDALAIGSFVDALKQEWYKVENPQDRNDAGRQKPQNPKPARHSSFYCNTKVGLGIGLDIAGTVASAIPGEGQALVLTQLGLSAASAIYSGVTHNSEGTTVAGAAYGLTAGGLESASNAVKRAIPIVGTVLGAAQTYRDIKTAQEDYEKCLAGE